MSDGLDVIYDTKNDEIRLNFYSMPLGTLSPDGFNSRFRWQSLLEEILTYFDENSDCDF